MNFDKNKFWDNKIIDWEDKRYSEFEVNSNSSSNSGLSLGSSLQFRLKKSAEILKPYLADKGLLELGCGSGLLVKALSNSKMRQYTGIDWASPAISKARDEFKNNPPLSPVEFMTGNFMEMDFPDFDVVVALGVLDWLELEEIRFLFSNIKPKSFLFSISEKRFSLKQWLHSIYVFFAYGWRSKGYVPRYYTVDRIVRIANDCGYKAVKIFRDPKLSFGTFLYQLD